MNTGKLRHRVKLQRWVATEAGSYGEKRGSWVDIDEYWADVTTLSGQEGVFAQQVTATATHQVRMRWMRNIDPKMRFMFKGLALNIEAVHNVEELNRELIITCTKVAVN